MNLETRYLGMTLSSPLVPSASPLTAEVDNLRKMEDAGASAVVLESLFEEQLRVEREELHHHLSENTDSFAEAQNFFPEPPGFKVGPEQYLEHIRRAKEAVKIPVIASLNGATPGGWTDFARQIEKAGADALELNIYAIPTDFDMTSEKVEAEYLEILRDVRAAVGLPVALKLGPYFTNMAYMARRFDEAGANALVLFNRFYQPDIDLETLTIQPAVLLSAPHARRLPMRWIAILFGRIKADLAATSGIHNAEDVIRMLMAGANVTMLCSVLLRYGIGHIRTIREHLIHWMEENGYESVEQMQGSMSQLRCADPSAYERAQYIKTLKTYKP